MKTTIDAKAMRTALAVVKPAVQQRNYGNPILDCVEIIADADANTLRLRTTDCETYAEHVVSCHVHAQGAAVVPFKMLTAAVKGQGDCVLSLEGDAFSVNVAGITSSIAPRQLAEFPTWPVIEPAHRVDIAASDLAYVLKCASPDATRPVLTGVNLSDGACTATDSWRLASATVLLDGVGADGVIVSAGMLRAAVKRAPASILNLEFSHKHAVCVIDTRGEQTTYIGRMIEASYPNWRQLMPSSTAQAVTFDSAEVVAILKRAPSDRGKNAVQVNVRIKRAGADHVELTIGDGITAKVAATYDGDRSDGDLICAFNPAFLVDLLSIADGAVTLRGVDHLKPWLTEDGTTLRGLLMPVRVS